MTQYVYDGLGNRVAKGSITTFSCDRSTNGYTETNDYLVRQDGKVVEADDIAGNLGRETWGQTGGNLGETWGGNLGTDGTFT